MIEYYDRAGQPITEEQWLASTRDPNNRIVVRTEVAPDVVVSTVWLGLDHSWSGEGPPIIFETMVFGGPMDGEQWRYSSEGQAVDGHGAVVSLVRRAMSQRRWVE